MTAGFFTFHGTNQKCLKSPTPDRVAKGDWWGWVVEKGVKGSKVGNCKAI